MKTFFLNLLVVVAVGVFLVQGRPAAPNGNGKGLDKPLPRIGIKNNRTAEKELSLERFFKKHPKLLDLINDCSDVCVPLPRNSTSALQCARCLFVKTGSPIFSDFISAVVRVKSEQSCLNRDKSLRGREDDYAESSEESSDSEEDDASEESKSESSGPSSEEAQTEEEDESKSESSEPSTDSEGGQPPSLRKKREEEEAGSGSDESTDISNGSDETQTDEDDDSEESASKSSGPSSEEAQTEEDDDSEESASESSGPSSEEAQTEEDDDSEESASESSESSASISKRQAEEEQLVDVFSALISKCSRKCSNLGSCKRPLLPCMKCLLKHSDSRAVLDLLEIILS